MTGVDFSDVGTGTTETAKVLVYIKIPTLLWRGLRGLGYINSLLLVYGYQIINSHFSLTLAISVFLTPTSFILYLTLILKS